MTLEGIEPETLRGAHSKIPSQPLDQPQMGDFVNIIII
jgi:hypothetical protein